MLKIRPENKSGEEKIVIISTGHFYYKQIVQNKIKSQLLFNNFNNTFNVHPFWIMNI